MTVDELIKNIPCDEKVRLAIQTIVQLAVELEREDCAKIAEITDCGVGPLDSSEEIKKHLRQAISKAIRGRK